MRWIEMNTFSDIIYRTHPSNFPEFNAQIWDNEVIANFFKKFSDIWISLAIYRKELMEEVRALGTPVVRSLMLEFEDMSL